MRRIVVIAISLGLLLAGAGAGTGSTSTRPTLKLARLAPLQVKATGFKSGERVRVRVVAPKPATKRLSASRTGSFVASFPDVVLDRCSGLMVVAVGARGSRAALKRADPQCPPPL